MPSSLGKLVYRDGEFGMASTANSFIYGTIRTVGADLLRHSAIPTVKTPSAVGQHSLDVTPARTLNASTGAADCHQYSTAASSAPPV